MTELPVRAAKFVVRKSWVVTGSVSHLIMVLIKGVHVGTVHVYMCFELYMYIGYGMCLHQLSG